MVWRQYTGLRFGLHVLLHPGLGVSGVEKKIRFPGTEDRLRQLDYHRFPLVRPSYVVKSYICIFLHVYEYVKGERAIFSCFHSFEVIFGNVLSLLPVVQDLEMSSLKKT